MYLCSFMRDNAIPKVIVDSLKEGGFALQIKGKAGTGKTLFALELIRTLRDKPAYYLTTRVSPVDLLKQVPWIERYLPIENILDARAARIPAELDFRKINTTNITAFIKELYEIMQQSEEEVITLIIDSIDAIKTTMGLPWDNYQLEKALFEIASVLKTNIVIIVERYDVIQLDYLVDGIIKTVRKVEDGRVLRYALIEKIRGQKITTPVVLFTLTGGKFGMFDCCFTPNPLQTKSVKKVKKLKEKVRKLSEKNAVPTGIDVIDNLLNGGLTIGSFNVLEIHPYIGNTYLYFLMPMIINMVKNKRLVYFIPPSGIAPIEIKRTIQPFISDTDFRKYIKIFKLRLPGHAVTEETQTISVDARSIISTLEETEGYVQEYIPDTGGIEHLGITGADTLQYTFGADNVYSILGRWSAGAKLTNKTEIVIAKKGQKILSDLVNMADTHFAIDLKRGTPVFYGNMPYTGYFGLDIKIEGPQNEGELAKIEIELIPIE